MKTYNYTLPLCGLDVNCTAEALAGRKKITVFDYNGRPLFSFSNDACNFQERRMPAFYLTIAAEILMNFAAHYQNISNLKQNNQP